MAHSQNRISDELRKKGVFVSGSGVHFILWRRDLENVKKRLIALEAIVASEGITLSEDQVAAPEMKKHEYLVYCEIEMAARPGSQDTFYLGDLKGGGRIYQQAFVSSYSKVAFCERYSAKTPITAVGALNEKVLLFLAI